MATDRSFTVTYDYRCPFARNLNEHIIDGLESGAEWDVRFVPYVLSQGHEGAWDRTADASLRMFELSVAVREGQPDRFFAAHRNLFAVRHDHGKKTSDPENLREALLGAGVDFTRADAEVATGRPFDIVRREHQDSVKQHSVWGVPTLIADGQTAFVRLMERPSTASASPARTVERLLDLLSGWPELNEFKHATLPK